MPSTLPPQRHRGKLRHNSRRNHNNGNAHHNGYPPRAAVEFPETPHDLPLKDSITGIAGIYKRLTDITGLARIALLLLSLPMLLIALAIKLE